MPKTAAGESRSEFDFARGVRRTFDFLIREYGYAITDSCTTFVRYEAGETFVNVFHGRASYELGVEIGRWIHVRGKKVEQKFPLGDIISFQTDPVGMGFQTYTATTRADLEKFLEKLAIWTKEHGGPALEGRAEFFDALSIQNARASKEGRESLESARLRARAEKAWHDRDYACVISAYEQISQDLETVPLKESEAGRLRYARRCVSGEGDPAP